MKDHYLFGRVLIIFSLCITISPSVNAQKNQNFLKIVDIKKNVRTLDSMGKLYDPNCHDYVKKKDYIRLGKASKHGKTTEQLYMDLDQRTERFIKWGSYAGKNARGLTFDYLNLIKSEKVKAEANEKYSRWSPFAVAPDMTYCNANPDFNQCLAFQVYCTQQMVVRGMSEALKTTEDQINHCSEDYNEKNKIKRPSEQCDIDKLSNELRWLKEHAIQLFQVAENALALDPKVKNYFDEAAKTFIKYIGDLSALKAAQIKAIDIAKKNIALKSKLVETNKIIKSCQTIIEKDNNDVNGHDIAGKLIEFLNPEGCKINITNSEVTNLAVDLENIAMEFKSDELDRSINHEALKNTAKAIWGTYKLFVDKNNEKDLFQDKKFAIDELICKYGKNDKYTNPKVTQKYIDELNKLKRKAHIPSTSGLGGLNLNNIDRDYTIENFNSETEKYFKSLPDFCSKHKEVLNEAHEEYVRAKSTSIVKFMSDEDTEKLLNGEFAQTINDIETECSEINKNEKIINDKMIAAKPKLKLNEKSTDSRNKYTTDTIPTLSDNQFRNIMTPDSIKFSKSYIQSSKDYNNWNPYDNGEGQVLPKGYEHLDEVLFAAMNEKKHFKSLINTKFDNSYKKLIQSKLGHLLLDKNFQKIVGTKSYEDLYDACRKNGKSGFKIPSLSEVNSAKKSFVNLQNKELKEITKQLVNPSDKVKNIQRYLRNNPTTIAHLLQKNPSKEYAKNLCAFIRDINEDDHYWQTAKTIAAPVGLIAGTGLSITGIGAPAGAGILGWVAGAGLVAATSVEAASFNRDIRLDEEGIRITQAAAATFQAETEDALKKIKDYEEDLKSAKFWLPMTILFSATDILPVSYARILKSYGKTNRGKALYQFFKIDDIKAIKDGTTKLAELQNSLKKGAQTFESLSKKYKIDKVFFKNLPQQDQFFIFGIMSKMNDLQADQFIKKIAELDSSQVRKLIDNIATDAEWYSKGNIIGKTEIKDLRINFKTLDTAINEVKKFQLPNGIDAETYFSTMKNKLNKLESSMEKVITLSEKAYSSEHLARSRMEGEKVLEKIIKNSGINIVNFNKILPNGEDYKLLTHYVNVLGEDEAKILLRSIDFTQDQNKISNILKAIDSNPTILFDKKNKLIVKNLSDIIFETTGFPKFESENSRIKYLIDREEYIRSGGKIPESEFDEILANGSKTIDEAKSDFDKLIKEMAANEQVKSAFNFSCIRTLKEKLSKEQMEQVSDAWAKLQHTTSGKVEGDACSIGLNLIGQCLK